MACDFQELQIVMGIPKAVGNTKSNESGLSVLSFLSGTGEQGFYVTDWQPQIAGLKSGGVFAESSVSPGRTLIAGEDGNVIETIQLTAKAGTQTLLMQRLTTLHRFRQLAEQFWTTQIQVEPVYLKWWAKDAPGPQYALIYTMSIAVDYPDVQQSPSADVSLVIEREPYWTPIAPGVNARVWSFEFWKQKYTADAPSGTNDLNLGTNTTNKNLFFDATLENNDSGANKNFVEIPSISIPGDAPALLQLLINHSTSATPNDFWISIRSGPYEYPNISVGQTYTGTIDASAGTLGTDASLSADATVASGNRVDVSFAGTATDTNRLLLSPNTPPTIGNFALYLRAYQNGGAAGDIKAHIRYLVNTGYTTTPLQDLPEVQFTVGATYYPMVYMGILKIPINRKHVSNLMGTGIQQASYGFQIFARRTTGVGTLRIADLVLMPLDEGHMYINSQFDVSKAGKLHYDNTGYAGHGARELFVDVEDGGGGTSQEQGIIDYRGPSLYLTPNETNRIYIIRTLNHANGNPVSTFGVWGNIVPRWRGVRDV